MPAIAIKDLPPGPGNYGTISYGNYTFSPLRQLEVAAEMVYDEADRVVTHIKYVLQARRCVIYGGVGNPFGQFQNLCNINMAAMQDELSQPGLPLVIRDIGFDRAINTGTNSPPDIIWGPKPRAINMRPVGGEFAWEFDWDCEFNVSRCASPGNLENALMAFNYDWTAVVNEQGLMTRTISGYLQVAAVRGQPPGSPTSRAVLFNVDAQWDQISFGVPFGFRRTQNVHTINKTKNRIDFAVTDTELTGSAFPAGIVDADVELSIDSQAGGLFRYLATLSGSLTVAPGYPKSLAAAKFMLIAIDKEAQLKAAAVASPIVGKGDCIAIAFQMRHSIFTRTSHLSITWTLTSDLKTLLAQSGMWAPVPGTDYQSWKASMDAVSVMGNRGVSGLAWNNADDKLIDICMSLAAPLNEIATNADSNVDAEEQDDVDDPKPESYLLYRNVVRPASEQNVVLHRFAQAYQPGQSGYADHVLQYPTAPDNLILMEGAAARLNNRPDIPALTSVGGQPVELLWLLPAVDQVPSGLSFGNAIYQARWRALYRITGEPALAGDGVVGTLQVANQQPLLGAIANLGTPI